MNKSLLTIALSALSAGLLISCVKPKNPDDDNTNNEPTQSQATNNNSTEQNTQSEAQNTQEAKNSSSADVTKIQPVQISNEQWQDYLTHVANDIIVPTYQNVKTASDELHKTAQQTCQNGNLTTEQMETLRKQWLVLAQTWATAEMINFGTATENMSHLYINYFPDERGVVHRSVQSLLTEKPNIKAEQLSQESAIAQGIPAIEDLLYSNETLDKNQCNYLISASQALSNRLATISQDWQKNGKNLLSVEQIAQNDDIGVNQWFNSLLSLLETVKSNGLDKPLGITGNKKGHLPAHTAKQSKAIIQAKLQALDTAFSDDKFVKLLENSQPKADNDNTDKTDGNPALAVQKRLLEEINQTQEFLNKQPDDLAQADPASQKQLYEQLTQITKTIKRELIPTLGIRISFNSTDGD